MSKERFTREELRQYWSDLSELSLGEDPTGLSVVCYAGLPHWFNAFTDAVHHERNGLLVTPLAADEYVAKITGLLQLPQEQLRTLGASFASFTQEHYGWDRTARRYLDVMREIAALGPPPRLPATDSEELQASSHR